MLTSLKLIIDIGLSRVVLNFLLNEGARLGSSTWMLVQVCIRYLECICSSIGRLPQPLQLILYPIQLIFGLIDHDILVLLTIVILLVIRIISILLRLSSGALTQLLLISLVFSCGYGGLYLFQNIDLMKLCGETGLLLLYQFLLIL